MCEENRIIYMDVDTKKGIGVIAIKIGFVLSHALCMIGWLVTCLLYQHKIQSKLKSLT